MVNVNLKATVPMLREVKLLRLFSDEELDGLVQIGDSIGYEPHTNIIIEGELSWGLFLILDGTVGIYKTNKLSGDIYDVGQLRTSNFFGEMSLVDENPRSATVRALSDCQMFYISKDKFVEFLDRSMDLKLRFYQSCAQDLVARLRELDENYVISQYQLWKAAVTGDAA